MQMSDIRAAIWDASIVYLMIEKDSAQQDSGA